MLQAALTALTESDKPPQAAYIRLMRIGRNTQGVHRKSGLYTQATVSPLGDELLDRRDQTNF